MLSACDISVPVLGPSDVDSRFATPHVLFDRARTRVEPVALAAQRAELGERDVARAAFRGSRREQRALGIELRRTKGLHAACSEGRQQDVRRRVQVVLRMTADELLVAGERNVALDDSRAHRRRRNVRFTRVFRVVQRRAAMAERERRAADRIVDAGRQLPFQGAVFEAGDERNRSWIRARRDDVAGACGERGRMRR